MIPRFLDLFDLDFFMLALRYTLGEQTRSKRSCRSASPAAPASSSPGCSLRPLRDRPVPGAKYNYAEPRPSNSTAPAGSRRSASVMACPSPRRRCIPTASPAVASVIPGGFRPEHVTANMDHFAREIPPRCRGPN